MNPPTRPEIPAPARGKDDLPSFDLPELTPLQSRLEARLGPEGLTAEFAEILGEGLTVDRFEILWRPAGLKRPGVVAQLHWPRLGTRVGLGLEPPLAHALVDRLLGFDRLPAQGRLQVTPVEWGILSFVAARALDRLEERPGPLGPWDLVIDRVGPDPFDPAGLGPIVTFRWRVRIGQATASARLWIPQAILSQWLPDDEATLPALVPAVPSVAKLASTMTWRAEAGTIPLPKGLAKLRVGLVLLIEGAPLTGTASNPSGTIHLVGDDPETRLYFLARAMPDSHASRLVLEFPLKREPVPEAWSSGFVNAPDAPALLKVELGRVALPADRLENLMPGNILELAREGPEVVELTANGKVVARGDLVPVDTELGVRVTRVFP